MLAAGLLPFSALLPTPTTTSTTTSTSYHHKSCNLVTRMCVPPLPQTKRTRPLHAAYSKSNDVPENSYSDMWEEPHDGSDSDYESEFEEEEEWESDQEASLDDNDITCVSPTTDVTTSQYDEELLREVEQLLTEEEREILEQNEAPVRSKISTAKWGLLQTLALSQQIPFMDKMLLEGVAIDAPDKDGLTALHKAVIGKREAVISHLLRKGANPHVRDKDGATPLHYAVQVGAMQTVKLLIKYKVDVNAEDNEGWTPLHVAIQSRCRDIAKVLLVNGADKTRRTKNGTSVLDLCLCYGKDFKSYDMTKLVKLVPAGIDP